MTNEERRAVMGQFSMLSVYFHHGSLPDFVVQAYASDVEHLPFQAVMRALETLRRQPKRRTMPTPGDVIALVAPDRTDDLESMANTIAGKIVKAVGAIGHNRPAKAREHLGELAWRVVQAKGGWLEICCNLQAADTGFFAQCRDLARSFLAEENAQRYTAKVLQNTAICDTAIVEKGQHNMQQNGSELVKTSDVLRGFKC